jgi:hypothetical protein
LEPKIKLSLKLIVTSVFLNKKENVMAKEPHVSVLTAILLSVQLVKTSIPPILVSNLTGFYNTST